MAVLAPVSPAASPVATPTPQPLLQLGASAVSKTQPGVLSVEPLPTLLYLLGLSTFPLFLKNDFRPRFHHSAKSFLNDKSPPPTAPPTLYLSITPNGL